MIKRNVDQHREELKRLEGELYFARQAIIELMPEDRQQILTSYYQAESRTDVHVWLSRIADQLVSKVEVFSSDGSDRAYCPLCGRGSSAAHDKGFSVPLGLTRHLTGWGNVAQCPVTKAAVGLAIDHWTGPFGKRR